ncbi:MAG: hypothetical protein Q9191_005980 [Dirinaria sp. TL-2023a]
MDGSDDDEDLKRAITLSLQDANPAVAARKEIINIDSDEDTTDGESNTPETRDKKVQAPSQTFNSMLGLDRKAMEQERLARKRKTSISPPPPSRKMQKLPDSSSRHNVLAQSISKAATTSSSSMPKVPDTAKGLGPADAETLSFPQGTVKKTWALGHPRTGNDIKIEEVLQRQDLQLAVLSSFQWDVDWLLRKLDTHRTQIMMVMQAETESTKRQYEAETAEMPNLRLCFPPMDGGQVNCMHSKLMLLSYPCSLRIVVPSANLVPYDWGETGMMENSAFIIDLPRLPPNTTSDTLTPFAQDLLHFLQAMRLDPKIVQSMLTFDFGATRQYAFVHSVGGTHHGAELQRTGYPGLARAVQQLNLQTQEGLTLDYITSSIGSLNHGFLITLYRAAQGDLSLPTTTSKKNHDETLPHLQHNFHLYFPSHSTVSHSTGGTQNGGTICFQRKYFYSEKFPREVLRDCRSVRKGLLGHHKILFVRPSQPGTACTAWAYIGSANASSSAWGSLTHDRRTTSKKLSCRNWECGVVVPLREGGTGGEKGLGIFETTVPVPMEYPGEEYKSGTGMMPWFYSEE